MKSIITAFVRAALLLVGLSLIPVWSLAAPKTTKELTQLTTAWQKSHPCTITEINVSSDRQKSRITVFKNRQTSKTWRMKWLVITESLSPGSRTFYTFYDDRAKAFAMYSRELNAYCHIATPAKLNADGALVSALMNGDLIALYPDAASMVTATERGFRMEVTIPASVLHQLVPDRAVLATALPKGADVSTYAYDFDSGGQLLSSSSLLGDVFTYATVNNRVVPAVEVAAKMEELRSSIPDLKSLRQMSVSEFLNALKSGTI